MLRKDFILPRARSHLQEFISPMRTVVDKPHNKFLTQALPAILFAESLRIKDMAQGIHDDCSDVFIASSGWQISWYHPEAFWMIPLIATEPWYAKHIHPDTPTDIDLTDLARPIARKMKYPAPGRHNFSKHCVACLNWKRQGSRTPSGSFL